MIARAVWKFPLAVQDTSRVDMPQGAVVLYAAAQGGSLWLWATVDPEAPLETRTFYIRGTGHPLREASDATFVGTIISLGGALVWHIFEGPVV